MWKEEQDGLKKQEEEKKERKTHKQTTCAAHSSCDTSPANLSLSLVSLCRTLEPRLCVPSSAQVENFASLVGRHVFALVLA